MHFILYPPGINWFYETFANSLGEDLQKHGHLCRLINPAEFLALEDDGFDPNDDVMVVSMGECAHSLGGRIETNAHYHRAMEALLKQMGRFHRRILLNLDGIHTGWFSSQITQVQKVITDIFDICMQSQTDRAILSGCRYTWIQESFTLSEREDLFPHEGQRPLPWSMIGHGTRERAEVAELLARAISPSGFFFLPPLRPFYGDGSRNLSSEALDRVLRKTQYYVWTSHHRFPYHEGLRALHAVKNGAIPVKIDPLFASMFRDIPWVYESLAAFLKHAKKYGHDELFKRARDFLLSRGTLGQHVAKALEPTLLEKKEGALPSRNLVTQ